MADELSAEVLAVQDGPVEETPVVPAVESTSESAETPTVGDGTDEHADAPDGETEPQKAKRLGGWQRKIQRLEEQNSALIRKLTERGEEPTTTAAKKPAEPQVPDFDTFTGTLDEYKTAVKEYPTKLREYLDTQRQQADSQRQLQELAGSFNERVRSLPEFTEMQKAAQSHKMSARLIDYMQSQLAGMKNGPEVFREAVMDADSREQFIQLDKLSDQQGIKAELHALSTGLRIASKKLAPATPVQETKAPPPPKPVSKGTVSDDGSLRDDLPSEEWSRRFMKKLEKHHG